MFTFRLNYILVSCKLNQTMATPNKFHLEFISVIFLVIIYIIHLRILEISLYIVIVPLVRMFQSRLCIIVGLDFSYTCITTFCNSIYSLKKERLCQCIFIPHTLFDKIDICQYKCHCS